MGLLKEQLAVLSEEFERLDTLGDDRSNDEANEALEVDLQVCSLSKPYDLLSHRCLYSLIHTCSMQLTVPWQSSPVYFLRLPQIICQAYLASPRPSLSPKGRSCGCTKSYAYKMSSPVDHELEPVMQIMSAERDFLETKVRQGRSKQEGLVTSLQTLRRQLLEAGLDPKVPLIRLQDLDDDLSASDAENQTDDDDQPRSAVHLSALPILLSLHQIFRLQGSLYISAVSPLVQKSS